MKLSLEGVKAAAHTNIYTAVQRLVPGENSCGIEGEAGTDLVWCSLSVRMEKQTRPGLSGPWTPRQLHFTPFFYFPRCASIPRRSPLTLCLGRLPTKRLSDRQPLEPYQLFRQPALENIGRGRLSIPPTTPDGKSKNYNDARSTRAETVVQSKPPKQFSIHTGPRSWPSGPKPTTGKPMPDSHGPVAPSPQPTNRCSIHTVLGTCWPPSSTTATESG